MIDTKQKLVVIDATAVLHRAWHALPKLTDPNGKIINAVYGFTVLLLKLLREQKPNYIVAAFDTKAPTFRHKKYKEYKAKRTPQPQEFYDQIPITKRLIRSFDIPVLSCDGFEADDLIAAVINNLKSRPIKHLKSIIVTGDLDLTQLVDEDTEIYFLMHGVSNLKIYNKDAVYQRYNLLPNQLVDFKALVGDPSDNIKGVPGVGPKTAVKLIKKFKNIENIYKYLESPRKNGAEGEIKESLANLLINNKKNAFLAKELVTIENKIENLDLDKIQQIKKINIEKITKTLQELGFNSLIEKIKKNGLIGQNKLF